MELLKNRVDLATALGTDLIVLHLHPLFRLFQKEEGARDRFYRSVFRTFDEMEPYCRTRGVRICLENLQGIPNEHQIYQFDRFFERYDATYMGFCCDTGHALISKREVPLELPARYTGRIYFIHCSDNLGDYDQHALPFEGIYDWAGFAKLVAKSPYELPVNLEVVRDPQLENAVFLERAHKAGERLLEMIEQEREGISK